MGRQNEGSGLLTAKSVLKHPFRCLPSHVFGRREGKGQREPCRQLILDQSAVVQVCCKSVRIEYVVRVVDRDNFALAQKTG